MHARVAPPFWYQRLLGRAGLTRAALLAAVVATVSVAVEAFAPFKFSGVVVPKLNVGGSDAPTGLEVIAAVSATLPVKPPAGVSVIVEVFPVVAPGDSVTAEPVIVKVGTATAVALASFDAPLEPVELTALTT